LAQVAQVFRRKVVPPFASFPLSFFRFRPVLPGFRPFSSDQIPLSQSLLRPPPDALTAFTLVRRNLCFFFFFWLLILPGYVVGSFFFDCFCPSSPQLRALAPLSDPRGRSSSVVDLHLRLALPSPPHFSFLFFPPHFLQRTVAIRRVVSSFLSKYSFHCVLILF